MRLNLRIATLEPTTCAGDEEDGVHGKVDSIRDQLPKSGFACNPGLDVTIVGCLLLALPPALILAAAVIVGSSYRLYS